MSKRSYFLTEAEVSGTDSDDESDDDSTGSLVDFIVDTESEAESGQKRRKSGQPRELSQLSEASCHATPVRDQVDILSEVASYQTPIPVRVLERAPPINHIEGGGRQRKYRRFCLTLNNYSTDEEDYFKSIADDPKVRYLCYGREVAPGTGTPHMQAYLEFGREKQLTLSGLRNYIFHAQKQMACRYHIEPANGKGSANRDYCKKDGNFWEFGEQPASAGNQRGQGKRSDLDDVSDICKKKGATLKDVAEEYPKSVIKYFKGINVLINTLHNTPRVERTLGYWCWGPTGTGKSRWAHSVSPGSTFIKDPRNRWFCGYTHQETVVMDDYRPNKECPFEMLLRLCDWHGCTVEVKGEPSLHFNSKRIIITSPVSIETAFQALNFQVEGQIEQLKRRFLQLEFGNGKLSHHLTIEEAEAMRVD